MVTTTAAELSAAHTGRTVTIDTAGQPATGTLTGLDVSPDAVTVTLEAAMGGHRVVDVPFDCPVELFPTAEPPAYVFASDLTGQHLGRAVDFGGVSRSHTGVLAGFQVHDQRIVTVILESERWFEVDPDCVLTFI